MTARDASTPPPDDPTAATIDQSRLLRQVGYRLTRAELVIHRRLVERLAVFALRPVEYSLLVLVEDNPGINQRDIGAVLGVSPPNLVGVIGRLAARHLVRRSRGLRDRRIQHLHLTAAGGRLLAAAHAAVREFNAALLSGLSAQESRALARALRRICAD